MLHAVEKIQYLCKVIQTVRKSDAHTAFNEIHIPTSHLDFLPPARFPDMSGAGGRANASHSSESGGGRSKATMPPFLSVVGLCLCCAVANGADGKDSSRVDASKALVRELKIWSINMQEFLRLHVHHFVPPLLHPGCAGFLELGEHPRKIVIELQACKFGVGYENSLSLTFKPSSKFLVISLYL